MAALSLEEQIGGDRFGVSAVVLGLCPGPVFKLAPNGGGRSYLMLELVTPACPAIRLLVRRDLVKQYRKLSPDSRANSDGTLDLLVDECQVTGELIIEPTSLPRQQ